MTAVPGMSEPDVADSVLVAAVAKGNLEALGQLFERHEPVLRRYLGRLGIAPPDADDLLQATFLEIVRASARFDPLGDTRNWLFGIATLMVRRHRRSVTRRAARILAWGRLRREESAPSPFEAYEGAEALRRFGRAFQRLSAKKREVFVLVTLEGLSGEDAAAVLQVPVNTVWTRLHHARHELMAAVGEELP
jgi:RNA polymerase sigma factor (sigma-70 family)